MRGKSRLLVLNLSLVLCVACSASAPSADVDLARASLKKAVDAGAGSLAVESLQAAERAQALLDAEMTAQQGKWFKSYDKARDLAIAAQAAGDKAAADAAAAKGATMAEATAATGDAQRGPNLFRNGDFTDGLQGWTGSPDSDATVSVDVSGPNERTWHAQYRKGNWSVIYQQLNLRPDTVYVYEAMLKSTAPIVALYWQAEIGRFLEIDKAYPEWTHLRYVFLTPHWTGQPYLTSFDPVLMKGPGDVWIKDLRLSQFQARGSKAP